jgi:hypothetical protein
VTRAEGRMRVNVGMGYRERAGGRSALGEWVCGDGFQKRGQG